MNALEREVCTWRHQVERGQGKVFKPMNLALSWADYIADKGSPFLLAKKRLGASTRAFIVLSFPKTVYGLYGEVKQAKLSTTPRVLKKALLTFSATCGAIFFVNQVHKDIIGKPFLENQTGMLIGRVVSITSLISSAINFVDGIRQYVRKPHAGVADHLHDLVGLAAKANLLVLSIIMILTFGAITLPYLVGLSLTTTLFILSYTKNFLEISQRN